MKRLASPFTLAAFVVAVGMSVLVIISGVSADNVGVVIGVGDTKADITGQAPPDGFVTIKDGDDVIATVNADADGAFTKSLVAQTAGIHDMSFFAKTSDGSLTDQTLLSVNFREHETTDIFVFLPSTITLSGSDVSQADELRVQGQTAPNATLTFDIDQSLQLQSTADASGRWTLHIASGRLKSGNHSITAYATDVNGNQSTPTLPRFFTIMAATSVSNQQTATQPPALSTGHRSGSNGGAEVVLQRPVIVQPKNHSQAKSRNISVAGLSEAHAQIELWRNHTLVGSVFADKHGGWFMTIGLQAGDNAISARVCSGQHCSGFSDEITITYSPVASPGATLRMLLASYRYSTSTSRAIHVAVTLTDGRAPYAFTIEWGDGTKETVNVRDSKTTLSHRYDRAGNYNGQVVAEDATGVLAHGFFSVEVRGRSALPVVVEAAGALAAVAVSTQILFGGSEVAVRLRTRLGIPKK
jgi:hypothetical protein